jgi:phage terminase large subunit GpA-like protein
MSSKTNVAWKKQNFSSELIFTHEQLKRRYDLVQELLDALPERIPDILVHEFAAQYRILPDHTPYPGRWQNKYTPYSVEIMEELSARSRTKEIIWIKCSQIGATAVVENFIAYIVRMVPGPTMYATSKEALLKKWVNKRLAPLARSCDLKFFAQHLIGDQKRSGNQMFSKEFAGGSLDMVSAQSESNMRMDSIRYLILDEAGAYKWSLQGFGDPIKIARARTANYRGRAKIFIPSTPGREGECRMWPLYEEGDQRRFFVPCPVCGAHQVLKFPSEAEAFYKGFATTALKWETKAGIIDKKSVHFDCESCKEAITEKHKFKMVNDGKWVPTAVSTDPLKKSYQINRLYSLMEDWHKLAKEEMDAQGDPVALQVHHNHNGGIPYREIAAKMDKARVYELRGTYKSGVIPSDEILFVTAAVDVQQGSKDDPNKPPRLEVEVCGHGRRYKTWSILYKQIAGAIEDPYDGAWEDLYQMFVTGGMTFRRSDGVLFSAPATFIDARDGNVTSVVFDFCQRLRNVYPIMGNKELEESKAGRDDTQTVDKERANKGDRYRINKRGGVPYILVNTVWYKLAVYRNLRASMKQIEREDKGSQFCSFPSDYPDKYFEMLVSEEQRADRSFYLPSSKSNESLDLRVYNLCAHDFYLDGRVEELKARAKRAGVPKEIWEAYNTKNILSKFEQELTRKDVTPAKRKQS